MKILAGARQRKSKNLVSFTVTTPDATATPAVQDGAPHAGSPLLTHILWGIFFLAVIESGVLAGMVYRMPMGQSIDLPDTQQDAENAAVVLDDQARQLGLLDRNGQISPAGVTAYQPGPIKYPAVTRLEDADIPGLPANLAKQQQQAVVGSDHQDSTPESASTAPDAAGQDLPAPEAIPRAPMPRLDMHTIFDRLAPFAKPAQPAKPPAAAEEAAPAGAHGAGAAAAPETLPPPGTMVMTPHPVPARPADPPETRARPVPPPADSVLSAAPTARRPATMAPEAALPAGATTQQKPVKIQGPATGNNVQPAAADASAAVAPRPAAPADAMAGMRPHMPPPIRRPAASDEALQEAPHFLPPPRSIAPAPVIVPARPVPPPPVMIDRPRRAAPVPFPPDEALPPPARQAPPPDFRPLPRLPARPGAFADEDSDAPIRYRDGPPVFVPQGLPPDRPMAGQPPDQ